MSPVESFVGLWREQRRGHVKFHLCKLQSRPPQYLSVPPDHSNPEKSGHGRPFVLQSSSRQRRLQGICVVHMHVSELGDQWFS